MVEQADAGVSNTTDHPTPVSHPTIGLCLSGGGYRALMFHTGALLRLAELGVLTRVNVVSGVSGGAIAVGLLVKHWNKLGESKKLADTFKATVLADATDMVRQNLDIKAILTGLMPWRNASDVVTQQHKTTIGPFSLPKLRQRSTTFQISAVSLNTGETVVFDDQGIRTKSKTLAKASELAGYVDVALAIAASGAFPPVLSPVHIRLGSSDWHSLVDGGATDNIGLTPEILACDALLISDAGGRLSKNGEPGAKIVPFVYMSSQIARLVGIVTGQPQQSFRKLALQLFADRKALAYWDLEGTSKVTPAPATSTHMDSLVVASEGTAKQLARTRTRLAAMGTDLQHQLINLGYAHADRELAPIASRLRWLNTSATWYCDKHQLATGANNETRNVLLGCLPAITLYPLLALAVRVVVLHWYPGFLGNLQISPWLAVLVAPLLFLALLSFAGWICELFKRPLVLSPLLLLPVVIALFVYAPALASVAVLIVFVVMTFAYFAPQRGIEIRSSPGGRCPAEDAPNA